ncbi:hypothetical protein HDU87_006211 [Geranomyces variabilis]|uniref:MYND-type domain-containing protein n=1 Tax=Geranomyces variabilis TaxID=109894 RepID=A0AAD5TFP5_9FUNG|nr:hypothetical protein HDU87_006211 [Geranomyces variabilis]
MAASACQPHSLPLTQQRLRLSHVCNYCGQPETTGLGTALDPCGNCQLAFYCSPICEELDWNSKRDSHSKTCVPISRRAPAVARFTNDVISYVRRHHHGFLKVAKSQFRKFGPGVAFKAIPGPPTYMTSTWGFSMTMEGPKEAPRWISFNGTPVVIKTVNFLFTAQDIPISLLVPVSWALTDQQHDDAGPDAAVGSAAPAGCDSGFNRDFRSTVHDGFWLDNPRFHHRSRFV